MRFNGNTVNGEMNLQQSGDTGQCSFKVFKFIIIVMLCALRHEEVHVFWRRRGF